MSYPPPTLWERLVLPFRIIYWRWFWKPIDYEDDEGLEDWPPKGCEPRSPGDGLKHDDQAKP